MINLNKKTIENILKLLEMLYIFSIKKNLLKIIKN